MISKDKIVYILAGTFLFLSVLIIGCAGNVAVPTDKLSNAEKAITSARESNAIVNAPLDLKLAEDKLNQAKEAVASEDYEKAARLADEATLDADVARAKTRAEKAKQISSEMRENIDSMSMEIERTQK